MSINIKFTEREIKYHGCEEYRDMILKELNKFIENYKFHYYNNTIEKLYDSIKDKIEEILRLPSMDTENAIKNFDKLQKLQKYKDTLECLFKEYLPKSEFCIEYIRNIKRAGYNYEVIGNIENLPIFDEINKIL